MKLAEGLRKTSGKHVEKPNIIKCEAKIKYLLAKARVNAIRGKDYINFNEFSIDLDNAYIKRRLESMGFRVKIIKDFRIYSGIFW